MSTSPPAPDCPSTGIDLWSDPVLADPYPTYARLRELGAVVWLERHGLYALTRFEAVRSALADWQTFSSAAGNCVEPAANAQQGASILSTDPPAHTEHRRTLAAQLSARSLAAEVPWIERTARAATDRVAGRASFDVVADLARPYALAVLGDLVGLGDGDREPLPAWSERAFNAFGPAGGRFTGALPAVAELMGHAAAMAGPGRTRPGTRGAELVEGGRATEIVNYTWPGLATTTDAIASAVHLFARHPEQWDLVRADPALVPSAFEEVLRLHAPLHCFTRLTTAPVLVEGVEVPGGSRVLVLYGSANRDERRYPEPDRFDVTRDPTDQLAFGRGVHLCPGMNLARLEAHALITALAERVEGFTPVGGAEWMPNSVLHGLRSATVSPTLAA